MSVVERAYGIGDVRKQELRLPPDQQCACALVRHRLTAMKPQIATVHQTQNFQKNIFKISSKFVRPGAIVNFQLKRDEIDRGFGEFAGDPIA